jgi:hypothetical protein
MTNGREGRSDRSTMAESQLSELQNMRVLLEEASGLSRNLAYHRRARLEARLGEALDEVDRQIVELRADRGSWRSSTHFGDKGIKKGRIGERSGPRGIPAALGGGFHEAFATSARNQVWKEGMV